MIKIAEVSDAGILSEMGAVLFGESSADVLKKEFADMISGGEAGIFIKYDGGVPIGFAQCQLRRDYVEGADSSPVGYLEGIYIKEDYRLKGYAAELLKSCEEWAKEQGCLEFASDCELHNAVSYKFHMASGFSEANRIICFTKKL